MARISDPKHAQYETTLEASIGTLKLKLERDRYCSSEPGRTEVALVAHVSGSKLTVRGVVGWVCSNSSWPMVYGTVDAFQPRHERELFRSECIFEREDRVLSTPAQERDLRASITEALNAWWADHSNRTTVYAALLDQEVRHLAQEITERQAVLWEKRQALAALSGQEAQAVA